MTNKIEQLTVEQNLLQLWYLQQEIQELESKRKEKTNKLKEIEKKQLTVLDSLNEIKQEQAKIHQSSLKQQKKIRENEKQLEKKRPNAIKVFTPESHLLIK